MASSLTYYRGVEFIKDYFVKFYRALFYAEEKDQIRFFDGTRKKEFSRRPDVMKKGGWDYRSVPVILVGATNGKFKQFLTNDFIDGSQAGEAATEYRDVGGDIELTIELLVYATTLEERDSLTDIASIYLAHPDTKTFFMKQYIRLPTEPRISEGGPIYETKIDFPVHYNTISMDAVGTWRTSEAVTDPRLLDIISDIVAVIDL